MDAALISTWERPARGREKEALGVFLDSGAFWQQQADAGRCQPREVFLSPDGRGISVVRGDQATLNEIVNTDEYRQMMQRIMLNVDGVTVGIWDAGTTVEKDVTQYAQLVAALPATPAAL